MVILLLLFGVLMSIPWLIPHMGFTALFGIVPLLCMERIADMNGTKRFWMWHYGAFVLWNALTTFWVCNATVGGGIFAVLANAFQMSAIFGVFRLSKKKFSGLLPYVFLAVMWIAWERFYFSAQISWPWLVLGNAFARSTNLIQWYEYTGTLGGSLWIWASNLIIFGLMSALSDGSFDSWHPKARAALLAAPVLVLLCPITASLAVLSNCEEVSEGKVDVIIGQPSFDPYQKFQSFSQQEQNAILTGMYVKALQEHKDGEEVLLLAPETFTNDIVCDDLESSPTLARFRSLLERFPGTGIIFGASSREFYTGERRNRCDYDLKERGWAQVHNSALSVSSDGDTRIFHKSKLVVGVESTPFPGVLIPLAEKIGVGTGRDVGQDEISLLDFNGIPVGCAVCYESIYGEYCTDYVKKGARFMTIITNDAWWGNTPGYKQHMSYASLRAIELRRDIARCGNTGISGFIDQRGKVVKSGPWWEQDIIRGYVNLNSKITFFAAHGDIIGRVCSFMFILLLLSLIVRFFTNK